jgi:ubiquinone/menaquinone biosynthesis C-methylase UbiE
MNERTFDAKHAHRLEDPERLTFLPPADVVAALRLRQGMTVADIGAGMGYFALPIAREIGKSGKVLAVDFQVEMLELLRDKLSRSSYPENIELVKGEAASTTLPDRSVDLVFLANVWHELDDHAAVLAEAKRIVRPGGRIAILDWRTDVNQPPRPPLEHRIAPEAVTAGIQKDGWRHISKSNVGLYSYLVQASSD